MFYDLAKSTSLTTGRKKIKTKRPCSKRHRDAFLKVEVRDVGVLLLMFPFSLQPDFCLTCFPLSPVTV